MTDNEAICRSCGEIISHVLIDRESRDKGSKNDLCFFAVSLNGLKVLIPLPRTAVCKNTNDNTVIANSVHCPVCGHYPFADDIELFDNGLDRIIVASTIPMEDDVSLCDGCAKVSECPEMSRVCYKCDKREPE